VTHAICGPVLAATDVVAQRPAPGSAAGMAWDKLWATLCRRASAFCRCALLAARIPERPGRDAGPDQYKRGNERRDDNWSNDEGEPLDRHSRKPPQDELRRQMQQYYAAPKQEATRGATYPAIRPSRWALVYAYAVDDASWAQIGPCFGCHPECSHLDSDSGRSAWRLPACDALAVNMKMRPRWLTPLAWGRNAGS
jgi:hypothetical protein